MTDGLNKIEKVLRQVREAGEAVDVANRALASADRRTTKAVETLMEIHPGNPTSPYAPENRGEGVRPTIVVVKGYVWCDAHGEVHGSRKDVYEDQTEGCNRINWRRVFVVAERGEEW